MSKQDRQGVRTPVDLERKYSFGQTFNRQGTQINQLNQEMSQFMAKTDSAIADLDESVAGLPELTRTVNSLRQSVTALDINVSSLDQSLSEINDAVLELEETIPGLVDIGQDVADLKEKAELLVTVQTDSLDTEAISADKTFADIDDAILAGKNVRIKLVSDSEDSHLYLRLVTHQAGIEATFYGYYNGTPIVLQLMADE